MGDPTARASIAGAVVLALLVAACSGVASSPGRSSSPGFGAGAGQSAATTAPESHCTDKGGMLVARVATWNTNGDASTWLPFAGHQTFCEFETGSGNEATRISVDLTTLSSSDPTLAAIAYLSKIRTTSPPQVGQNPAQWSCANDFDGTAAFGNTAAGGGWVDASQPVFVVMNQCAFADGSAIDEFGLWYHANGTVRGADLAPLFAYQPGDKLPAVYERQAP